MPLVWPRLASLHGYAMALAGQHEDGVALTERALQASMAMRLGQEETLRRARGSEAYLLAGRIDEARDSALDIARLHPSLLTDSAEHHYREALPRADDLGMRPLVAHCHLGLGKMHRRDGKRERAQ
jgi:hypothetical protein